MSLPDYNHPETIDPEILPPINVEARNSFHRISRLAIFGGLGLITFAAVSSARSFFPLICFGLATTYAVRKIKDS